MKASKSNKQTHHICLLHIYIYRCVSISECIREAPNRNPSLIIQSPCIVRASALSARCLASRSPPGGFRLLAHGVAGIQTFCDRQLVYVKMFLLVLNYGLALSQSGASKSLGKPGHK